MQPVRRTGAQTFLGGLLRLSENIANWTLICLEKTSGGVAPDPNIGKGAVGGALSQTLSVASVARTISFDE